MERLETPPHTVHPHNSTMTEQHKATPEQWAQIERTAEDIHGDGCSALLELRARVEALEATQHVHAGAPVYGAYNEAGELQGVVPASAFPAPGDVPFPVVPPNCRQRLQREGKPCPKSSCEVCGPMSPMWLQCNAALVALEPTAPSPAGSLVERVGDLELVTEALRDQWFEQYETQTRHPLGLLPVAARHGYLLGYRAALRDAVDQVLPEVDLHVSVATDLLPKDIGAAKWSARHEARQQFLAIAAELDGGMSPLSPAPQAVFDAADGMEPRQYRGRALAAALCAAVGQIDWNWEPAAQLLAIAAELDGGTTANQETSTNESNY
jgi:hypothetical protein